MNCETRVLYCGMATDIMPPLLLVPGLDVLFAIDLFDAAYSPDGTEEGQRQDIAGILESGSDAGSTTDLCRKFHKMPAITHELPARAEILRESLCGETWRLEFSYRGKPRRLIQCRRDFQTEPWPAEIDGVEHVMSMGAVFEPRENPVLQRMLRERTADEFLYYKLACNANTDRKVTIGCGLRERGRDVGVQQIRNFKRPG